MWQAAVSAPGRGFCDAADTGHFAGAGWGRRVNSEIIACSSSSAVLAKHWQRVRGSSVVNIATALHRIAKHRGAGVVRSDSKFRSLLLHAERITTTEETRIQPQELASIAWAVAKLGIRHVPLIAAIAASSIRRLRDFQPQHISNLAWACATLTIGHSRPLFASLAAQARPRITLFGSQALTNTSWSMAPLRFCDDPLIDSIASQAIPTISEFSP